MPHQCTECGKAFEDGSTEMLSGCPECGGNKFQYLPENRDTSTAAAASSEEPPEPPEPPVEGTVARTVGNAATAVRDLVGSDSPPAEQSAAEEPPSPTDEEVKPAADERPRPAADERPSPAADQPSPAADERPSPAADDSPRPTADERPSTAVDQPGTAVDQPSVSAEATDASVETGAGASTENSAQASARTEVISRDDLPSATETAITAGPARQTPAETPSTAEPSPPTEDEESEADDDRPGLDQLRDELNDQFESVKVIEPGQYELNLMELYDREEYIVALQEDGKYTIQVPDHWED